MGRSRAKVRGPFYRIKIDSVGRYQDLILMREAAFKSCTSFQRTGYHSHMTKGSKGPDGHREAHRGRTTRVAGTKKETQPRS